MDGRHRRRHHHHHESTVSASSVESLPDSSDLSDEHGAWREGATASVAGSVAGGQSSAVLGNASLSTIAPGSSDAGQADGEEYSGPADYNAYTYYYTSSSAKYRYSPPSPGRKLARGGGTVLYSFSFPFPPQSPPSSATCPSNPPPFPPRARVATPTTGGTATGPRQRAAATPGRSWRRWRWEAWNSFRAMRERKVFCCSD